MDNSDAQVPSSKAPKVFISWSGDRSLALAQALNDWITLTVQGSECFVSANDVRAGSRWVLAIGDALNHYDLGILCVTTENRESRWLMFEAGALSKNIGTARVIPVLLDFDPVNLDQPLSQFQAYRADESGMRHVFENLASGLQIKTDEMFGLAWGKLEAEILKIAEMPGSEPPPEVNTEAMLSEMMLMLRGLEEALTKVTRSNQALLTADHEILVTEILSAVAKGDHPMAEHLVREFFFWDDKVGTRAIHPDPLDGEDPPF